MTVDEIRELIKIVTETGVAELEVQRGENRVRILRALAARAQDYIIPAHGVHDSPAPAPAHNPAPAPAAPSAGPAAAAALAAEAALDPSVVVVRSPIVGTFYDASAPGANPFVRVGDTVHPGQVLCIIESMKLMNEIEAEMAGVVVGKLVANAQPVEYGEGLFTVRPL
ncbi:MAG: acetyl-CoA carboxylase biotin carboxyl carrier protein [Acidobacteria bacterium]|nr:acetyl-CoA carboxylase biotin carboxyl carrier protein [Acidobacteriota bacterium]